MCFYRNLFLKNAFINFTILVITRNRRAITNAHTILENCNSKRACTTLQTSLVILKQLNLIIINFTDEQYFSIF